MSILVAREQWRKSPQRGGLTLDPRWARAEYVWHPRNAPVPGQQVGRDPQAPAGADQFGEFVQSANNGLTNAYGPTFAGRSPSITSVGGWSVVCVYRHVSAGWGQGGLVRTSSRHGLGITGGAPTVYYDNTPRHTSAISAPTTHAAVIIARMRQGGTDEIYVDGELGISAANGGYNYTGTLTRMGSGFGFGHTIGNFFLAASFPWYLSSNEVEALSENPWQIFAPVEKPVFYSLGGGGGTTDGVGTSVGGAVASASSQTIAASVGGALASAGASSQSQAVWQGVGSSVAAGSAQAVGTDGAAGVTAADGVATATSAASGAGRAVWGALGASFGYAPPLGVSQTIELRAATAAGEGTATADGAEASAYEPRAAAAVATSLATAASHVVVAAIGAIVSTVVASGVSDAASSVQEVVGVALAVAVATGVARAVWAATGASTGSGAAEGYPPQTMSASQLLAQIVVQTITPEVRVRAGPTTIRITI